MRKFDADDMNTNEVPGRMRRRPTGVEEAGRFNVVGSLSDWTSIAANVFVVVHIIFILYREVKVMSRAKHWCFTLNNYTQDDVDRLSNLISNNEFEYIVFGREVGEEGTPHLQGFVSFKRRKRMEQCIRLMGQMHFSVARNVPAARDYCKKGNDFEEFGTFTGQGKRTEIEAFKDSVKGGNYNIRELMENHSACFAKYERFCRQYVETHRPKGDIEEHELYAWQQTLDELLSGEPDGRKIIFVVDPVGDNGKSWFAVQYCLKKENAQYMLPGKQADMSFILNTDNRVLFLDCARSKQGEFIQYDWLENVKNGWIFSSKYESVMKRLARCHIVVMMNEQPDMTKLSEDRYQIIDL